MMSVMCLASFGSTIWSCSRDSHIRIWDPEVRGGREGRKEERGGEGRREERGRGERRERVSEGRDANMMSVMCLASFGSTVWSCSRDSHIRIWDPEVRGGREGRRRGRRGRREEGGGRGEGEGGEGGGREVINRQKE